MKKHYELLNLQEVQVDMPRVQFELVSRRAHKTWVLVMEPDYLPDSEVLSFSCVYTP